jgi:acetylglutamate kinase
MKELLNTRVITTEDITNISNVPVVATVSHSKSGKALVVSKDAVARSLSNSERFGQSSILNA